MKVIFATNKIELIGKSIFLAGPTPRSLNVSSWRPEALNLLDKLKFNGTVLVPEPLNGKFNFDEHVEWEWTAGSGCVPPGFHIRSVLHGS